MSSIPPPPEENSLKTKKKGMRRGARPIMTAAQIKKDVDSPPVSLKPDPRASRVNCYIHKQSEITLEKVRMRLYEQTGKKYRPCELVEYCIAAAAEKLNMQT